MTFQVTGASSTGFLNQNLVDMAMLSHEREGRLRRTVKLSKNFYEALTRHPVPLRESAIRTLSDNSQSLDIYCWLAHRLHALGKACLITWKSLYAQFGTSYNLMKNLRSRFLDSLHVAVAVYPEARVDADATGIVLRPSRPPFPPRPAPTW